MNSPAGSARTPRERFASAVTVGGYRTGALLASALPAFLAEGLATPIGFGANFANAQRRAIVAHHLRRVRPDWPPWRLRQATQEAFDSYARYWIEALRLPSLSARTVAQGIQLTGFSQVTEALERGTGAILALPHLGGWEWAGRWLGDDGHRITVIVEQIEPPELFEWFVGLRTELGMNVVPLGPGASRAVLAALGNNEIVCLLCDRDIGGGGVEVEFFGEVTTLPAGPATLGLRAGAPVFPVGAYFTRRVNGHLAVVRHPVPAERQGSLRDDVTRMTTHLAGELEYLIRRAPEQWHLFQPNWPSDPGYARPR
ncbi:MAG: phosphatidylinositol mannoside acyltransferase [Acidimicrobiia bacterium]|nr:phosphatidylinositol mannoside acyltransferase [Acidimicrobiia bacterium]